MRRKEVIEKKVILVRTKLNVETAEHELDVIKVNECFLYKGNYSLEIDNYNYYCKNVDYYSCDRYAFIINLEKEKEAINSFLNHQISKLNENISFHERMINKVNTRKQNINKLKHGEV